MNIQLYFTYQVQTSLGHFLHDDNEILTAARVTYGKLCIVSTINQYNIHKI